ncbi:MAG: CotH kinase family protein [Cyanobacteria bacterium]|nr:CotH kinase family protein [Cyanobacteriota bacterium]
MAIACALSARGPRLHAQTAADLFDGHTLQRLDIDLHSADWAKLRQEFQSNQYYPADITWNGIKAYNAGIRSRGAGSRNQNKPSLKIDFNYYASGQSYLGLKSLVLDNLVQDPSGVHETASMWFMARLGVPAPRESHAAVYVDGVYSGVYALVEPIDKNLIARVFGNDVDGAQNDGYLYEFNKAGEWWLSYLGPELEPYKRYFEARTHETQPDETLYRPIELLVRLINEKPAEELNEAVGPYLDLRGLTRFLAIQNFISEIDGFAGKWGMNNFYLYRLPQQAQHRIIAWDDDLAFLDPSYDVTSFQETNILVKKLMEVPEYRALYFQTLGEAIRSSLEGATPSEPGALESEIRRELDVIDGAMLLDPVRPYTETEYVDAREFMKQFAPRRARYVECEVARLTGARPCQ